MSSHYGHLQQIKYKLIIIVTMLECKTVTLRTRPLKNGMLSYYLDYYPGYRDQETMKTIRHEGLNIYIYANPKNERERNFNATMSEKAEAIRCRRFESIVNDRYDFFDRHKLKADFLEYYRKQLRILLADKPQDLLSSRRCGAYRFHRGGQEKRSEVQRQDYLITE